MRILVADDDPVARTLIERNLQRWGYQVITANDGDEAWSILQGPEAPRIALLDWMMPGLTGPDICREIRQRVSTSYSYLVLVTSRNQKLDVIHGFEAGADDYLTKPVNPAELHARLHVGFRILRLEDKLVAAREEMQYKATHDSLTRLMNRATVDDFLRRELARSQREHSPLGVLLADIDHFKAVNDTYGHAAGDNVIREISSRLVRGVRGYDVVGRYGGEEFLIVLPGCDTTGILERANSLTEAMRKQRFRIAAGMIAVTISIGAACSLDWEPTTPAALIHAADMALYRAKHEGRNRVVMAKTEEPAGVSAAELLLMPQKRA